MEDHMDEPNSSAQPGLYWPAGLPGGDQPSTDAGAETPPDQPATIPPHDLEAVAAYLRVNPAALAQFVASLAPEGARSDGWTPFARKLFLQVLADTGRLGLALTYVGLSRQSANNLYHRDPLFAAGWDAAAHMARRALADDVLEKGLDGITETVTRQGEVVATRHRYDARLSMAVLHRLDKRCDRAEEQGSAHLAATRRWDEYLEAIGTGDEAAARAILESASHCQPGQLPLGENPTKAPEPPGMESWDPCWQDTSGRWLTDFPPPPGFKGYENTRFDGLTYYERACTPEEIDLVETHNRLVVAAAEAEDLAAVEAARDSYFANLRAELEQIRQSAVTVAPLPPAKTGRRAKKRETDDQA
jgi:hypothetical protein